MFLKEFVCFSKDNPGFVVITLGIFYLFRFCFFISFLLVFLKEFMCFSMFILKSIHKSRFPALENEGNQEKKREKKRRKEKLMILRECPFWQKEEL